MTSRRELVLLIMFLSVLVVVASLVGWRLFSRQYAERQAILAERTSTLKEMNNWLEAENLWKARKGWLKTNPLPAFDPQHSEANFVQNIQSSLQNDHLVVTEQKIEEVKMSAKTVGVGIDLVLSAPLESIVKWLYKTQQVGAFRSVSHLKIVSDQDSSKMKIEISLLQWYSR